MEENIEEVEKIEEKIELNYEEREKLKEFLKKNLQIMIENKKIEDKTDKEKFEIRKAKEEEWKKLFENNEYYKNIIILDKEKSEKINTATYPAFIGFKHFSLGDSTLRKGIYPIFYHYTDKENSSKRYLLLAFGTGLSEDKTILWDNRLKSISLMIYTYFKNRNIEVKESYFDSRINEDCATNDTYIMYKAYTIEDNLEEQLDNITSDFEEILKYYISYIELYNKYKDRINNDKEIEEKDLKEILEYYRDKENTPEKKDEYNKEIKEYNKKFFRFSKTIQKFDFDFYFSLNTILYGTSKIKDIMYNIIRCSIYIIQRKFVKGKTNLESFKGFFLNEQIKYIPSDKEYSLKEFEEFCNEVKKDRYNNNYVLIFENIDKRDKSKIFGEDFSKLKERICNKEDSELYKNLYILATTSKTSFHIEDIEFFKNFDFKKIDSNDEYIKNIGEMDEEIKEIFKINKKDFKFPLNTILYGPPGTGKTYNSIFYSVGVVDKDRSIIDMIEEKNNNILDEKIFLRFKELKEVKEEERQIEFITFHQSYSYEDFVEGIRPTLATKDNEVKEDSEDKKDLKYTIHSGIFKNICERAKNNQDKNYVLIIDEINRGNISKIFGELISLLEPTKRLEEIEELKIRLPYSGEEFGVPKNLYILGTMNTADRSIALLDIALRRRFNFIEMPPKYDLLKEKIEVENDKIELRELLKAINNRIEFLLDKDHLIGHSYLVKVETFDDLKEVFRNSIMPLLQEYFYDDFEKIKFVLNIKDDNNSFIIKKETPQNFSGTLKTRLDKKSVYEINEEAFDDHKKYSKIYPEEAPTKADKNITEKVEPHDN